MTKSNVVVDSDGRIPEPTTWRGRLDEWAHDLAYLVAPRTSWRLLRRQSPRTLAAELVDARDWQALAEVISDRIITGRDLAAVAAGDRHTTYRIAVGLLARTTTWSHAVVAEHEWGPEWGWYLHRHVTRVSRALTHLETGW